MEFIPKEYQPAIIDHIIDNQRCNVWASMGSGKSVCTLTAADILWNIAGSNLTPALVLAPLRPARDVWSGESAKWDHLNGLVCSPVLGSPKERTAALARKADVYTINYENVQWLVEQFNKKPWPFKWCIADEATKLKGFRLRKGTKRAAALSKIAKYTGRWTNLTGTPAPNGLVDLWGPNWFVDQGQRLGATYTKFFERWFDKDEYTRKVTPKIYAQDQIMKALADITISVEVDAPDPVPMPVYFDLPRRAREVYSSMENTLYAELGPDVAVEAMSAVAASMKCLQMTNGAVYINEQKDWEVIHDAKLKVLEEIIDETGGQPLLVSYWFVSDRVRLLKHFPFARELKSEQDMIDWNNGKIAMGIGHPQSIGHGMNLQDGGCVCVFFSQTWNLELRQQFIERIGPVRQQQAGHPRPVLVYDILARNTIDELVQCRINEKCSIQEALMAAYRWRR